MQRRLGSPHGHQQMDDESTIAAAAYRQQQQRAQIQLQQQLQQIIAASGAASNSSNSSFNNAPLLSSQQQQQAAALALFSDMRAAALETQLRQAVQLQQLNNHQQLVLGKQQQQQDNLLLARALAGNQCHINPNLLCVDQHQQIFAQNRQQQHPANLQELELRLLQEQKLIERQKQQQQQRASLLASVAQELPQDNHSNAVSDITNEERKSTQLSNPPVSQITSTDRKHHQMKNINGDDSKQITPSPICGTPVCGTHPENKINVPPGAILVPCRARGMPMDHNFKTAYFVIPNDIRHGDELRCSYPACYNSGIKFRYCTNCKIPVSKRNFRKRHNHGMSPSQIDGSDDEKVSVLDSDDNDSMVMAKSNKCTVAATCPNFKNPEADAQSSASALVSLSNTSVKSLEAGGGITSDVNSNESRSSNVPKVKEAMKDFCSKGNLKETSAVVENRKEVISPVAQVDPHKFNKTENPSLVRDSGKDELSDESEIDDKRVRRWAELLKERPSTGNNSAMSDWLLKVLSVSDFEKPLKDDYLTNGRNPKNQKVRNDLELPIIIDNNQVIEQDDNDSQVRSKPMKKRSQSSIRQKRENHHGELTTLVIEEKGESSDRKKKKISR